MGKDTKGEELQKIKEKNHRRKDKTKNTRRRKGKNNKKLGQLYSKQRTSKIEGNRRPMRRARPEILGAWQKIPWGKMRGASREQTQRRDAIPVIMEQQPSPMIKTGEEGGLVGRGRKLSDRKSLRAHLSNQGKTPGKNKWKADCIEAYSKA